jgi:DNA invertase Pin-like site-specific DNA recombinase
MLHHSALTREGLRKAKERGVLLGGARPNSQVRHDAVKALADAKAKEVKPTIEQFRNDGLTYSKIADKLNETNVPTARGGKWYASTVRRYYKREV